MEAEHLARKIKWLKGKTRECERRIQAQRDSPRLRQEYAGYLADLQLLEKMRDDRR